MFSKLTIIDLLVFSGLALLASGGWFYVGPLVLVALGTLFLAVGLWLAWQARPQKGR